MGLFGDWYFLSHPARFLLFFIALLGASLSPYNPVAAEILGFAVVTIFVLTLALRKRRQQLFSASALPWLCLFILSTLSALMIAEGRCYCDIDWFLSSRYLAHANLVWASFLPILYICYPGLRKSLMVVLLLIIFSNAYFSKVSFSDWRHKVVKYKQAQAYLETVEVLPPWQGLASVAFGIFPNRESWETTAATFERLEIIHHFALPQDVSYVAQPADGHVDGVSPLPKTASVSNLSHMGSAWGWVILEGCQPARHILLTSGFQARAGSPRGVSIFRKPLISAC